MIDGVEVSGDQPSEMQLAGRLALSAAALLLLTLAYRYYKSRVSAGTQRGDEGKAGPGEDPGPTEHLVCRGEDGAEALLGLRHRRPDIKGVALNGREARPPTHLEGAPVGRQGTPVGRQLKRGAQAEEEEEEEEEERAKRESMSQPSAGWQAGRKCLVLGKQDEERGDGGAEPVPSEAMAKKGVSVTEPGGRPPSADLLGPGSRDLRRSESHREEPSQEAVQPGLCLSPCELRGGPSLPPAKGAKETMGGDAGQAHEAQTGLEKAQVFRATSNVGLAISQSDAQSSTTHRFFSVAEVQVEEESVAQGKRSEGGCGGPPAFPGGGLRRKVYDYYVQSISQSVSMEKPSYATLGLQPGHEPPALGLPSDSGAQPSHSLAMEEENGGTLPSIPAVPSGAPSAEGDEKSLQPKDLEKTASEANVSPKPSKAGRSFTRKESFHKIIENPELQVPMEAFGSPASGSSGNSTPLPRPLHPSSSVASLVESMQSLHADRSEEPTVEFVAGAKFFHIPLSCESSVGVHLDLGNCYELLCVAKKQKLDGLRDAAYKVMSDNYLQVLRTHAIYGRLNALERDLILQRRLRGRKCVTVADVSSQDRSRHASRVCSYDGQSDSWRPLTHLPVEAVSKGCAVCSMANYLFVVAGCEGRGQEQRPSRRVFCYNPLTNIWREISPLNQARPQCKLVALDGCLYAIGGECLYTVERYDPRLDRWAFAAPLPNDTFAVAHTATVCDGEIYVTGGTLRYMLLKYASRTDTWKVTLTAGGKDRTTEMVTANGFIYRFDLNRSTGISVYRCSAKAKLWYECATYPLPFPACFQCAVLDNLVYCIGRQFNVRFLADYVSPRFGTKALQNFPSPRGTLFPVTLVLPERETAAQTRV